MCAWAALSYRSDGHSGNPRFFTLSTLSLPQPTPSQIAAQKQTTSSLLEFLLSTATRLQHLRLSCRSLQRMPAASNLGQLSDLRSLTIS